MTRIPVTMFHGISLKAKKPFTKKHLNELVKIAHEEGFASINYNDLELWCSGTCELPERPIMFDIDHAVKSLRYEVFDVLNKYGYKANLFIHTGPLEEMHASGSHLLEDRKWMTWEEIEELLNIGWHIGAHTVTHPNLSDLSLIDPTGEKVRAELVQCRETIQKRLGILPKDFAFTGTSWSYIAEREVVKLFRFGRLWIIGTEYQVDGKTTRYADLAGVPGKDESDGGPPYAARYITRQTDPYRLPSMDFQYLIYKPEAFRQYLEGALE